MACIAGGLFSLFLYAGLSVSLGNRLRVEHSAYAVTAGGIIGVLSLRLLPCSIHVAGLSGMVLSVVATIILAGYVWPDMPYGLILEYVLWAGLAGMASAGLVVFVVLRVRAHQQM
ncbi:hypothetical protein RA263_13960 [Pseudomonas syringae pv. tagetis]|uniref:Uncharacterized protein n=1 Tax=Pseudomonas syringae pv. tagetis TaxID=129140 RepID=A0A0N8T4C3_9PSED|nr:hypothetical protein [Pseudomonas syringae group genomosp. 7]KPY87992.1 hypothetical protein ALO44_02271 [Pseudomonas syringae pv. tagetis]UNB71153.1 hypothetical protein MME58_02380 [Pseudomonas syringae pv. tagetis]